MNDRIQELVKQANREIGEQLDQPGVYLNFGPAKHFAELIVKECAKFLEENSGYDNANNAWHPEPEELLQHFGVKE